MSDASSNGAPGQKGRSPARKKPFKLRLPLIPNEELIEKAMVHSPELRGMQSLVKTMHAPARYGENLAFMTVPELYAATAAYNAKVLALVLELDPDLPSDEVWAKVMQDPLTPGWHRWRIMHTWLFHHHVDNGFSRAISGLMAGMAQITPAMIQEINFPDSDIWTDDERLCILFVKAIFNFEMTDELWDACAEAWGVKWILSVTAMLTHFYGEGVLFEMVGLDRVEGLSREGLAGPPPGGG